MDDLLIRWAELIIRKQLQLRQGDSLSVNTESSTIDFARLLARLATQVTLEPVHIVETKRGRVLQSYPIDPAIADALRPKITGAALCRIVDLDSEQYSSEESPQDLVRSVVQLGHFGLLADPVDLERRVGAPWVTIPYPGANWGLQYLGVDATEGDMWSMFRDIMRLDSEDAVAFWDGQTRALAWRRKKLNDHLRERITVRGDEWHFSFRVAPKTLWTGGETELPSGRRFIPVLPLENLLACADSSSVSGKVKASRPFLLLGKKVEGASFLLKDGEAVSWDAASGKDALDAFFSIDEGARHFAGISVADEATRESRWLTSSAHRLFNRAATTHIIFGGFPQETMDGTLTEKDLEDGHMNQSLVQLDVPVGSPSLRITATDEYGVETVLMDEGVLVSD